MVAGLVPLLAACGGGGDDDADTSLPAILAAAPADEDRVGLPSAEEVARLDLPALREAVTRASEAVIANVPNEAPPGTPAAQGALPLRRPWRPSSRGSPAA